MHDTLHILPDTLRAVIDTLRYAAPNAKSINYTLWGTAIAQAVSLLGIILVFLTSRKSMTNALRLAERQTYVDIILRNKDKWKNELMELAADIVEKVTDFVNATDSDSKIKLKARISSLVTRMQSRLSKNEKKYPAHRELWSDLSAIRNFVTGKEHPFQSNDDIYLHLERLEEKTYSVCKHVWDEIQDKCNWKGL